MPSRPGQQQREGEEVGVGVGAGDGDADGDGVTGGGTMLYTSGRLEVLGN